MFDQLSLFEKYELSFEGCFRHLDGYVCIASSNRSGIEVASSFSPNLEICFTKCFGEALERREVPLFVSQFVGDLALKGSFIVGSAFHCDVAESESGALRELRERLLIWLFRLHLLGCASYSIKAPFSLGFPRDYSVRVFSSLDNKFFCVTVENDGDSISGFGYDDSSDRALDHAIDEAKMLSIVFSRTEFATDERVSLDFTKSRDMLPAEVSIEDSLRFCDMVHSLFDLGVIRISSRQILGAGYLSIALIDIDNFIQIVGDCVCSEYPITHFLNDTRESLIGKISVHC